MILKRVELFNFTVFESLMIDFCSGVNIFIGDNGTGKTHLLKIIYAYYDSQKNRKGLGAVEHYFSNSTKMNRTSLRRNLIPQVGAVANYYADKDEPVWKDTEGGSIYTKGDVRIIFNKDGNVKLDREFAKRAKMATFIPAKEMLSHSESLLALERERFIPFDKTLIDIVAKASIGEANEISKLEQNLLDMISKLIEGTVICENDVFYILKKDGFKVEFSLEAEGLRKFGLLWKLIRNGLLGDGAILLWDEPEANINPLYLPILVDILFELAKNGVQIFIATHEYNLAKYFEIKKKRENDVLYHSFCKSATGVKHISVTKYKDIEKNPIEEANEVLYDAIIERAIEDVEND